MKFIDYLADRMFSIACLVAAGLLMFSLLWLIETPLVFVVLLEGILLAAFAASLIYDYARRRSYYNQLLALLAQLREKTLLGEMLVSSRFLDGQIMAEVLRQSNKYFNDRLAEMEWEYRNYQEYLETWVHEIKTPITSARMVVENDKNASTLRIDDELRKIDGYVEQVLYYARSTVAEQDFRVEKTTVFTLVKMAIKTYSKPLIQAGGKPVLEGSDVPVNADTKGCSFVIGQIISNAIKYRKENFQLTFVIQEEKNSVCLLISDNGVGISHADISRVFEKGFTGENGRRFTKSTGIGLYLSKKLCDKMNIALTIASETGSGTTVMMCFPLESYLLGPGA